MKYFKKLVGDRIYLSPISADDADSYVKWLNDHTITDGLGSSCMMISVSSEKEWIAKNASQHQFAIVSLDGDELLGNCGFQVLDQLQQTAEVGLFLGEEENRNKGYGAEVLSLLLEYGFNCLNLNNIMLSVYDFNERAIACYKKVGFKEFGRRRQAYFVKGSFHDKVYMDILREEYTAT